MYDMLTGGYVYNQLKATPTASKALAHTYLEAKLCEEQELGSHGCVFRSIVVARVMRLYDFCLKFGLALWPSS